MNAQAVIAGDFPRWAIMWLLAGALFFAGKLASLRGARLGGWRRGAFVLGWAGMDAGSFREDVTEKGASPLSLCRPLLNIFLGVVLLWGVARHFTHPLAAGWVGMIGLIFLLHFGVFGVLARVWYAAGIRVTPIMHCPVAATSLTEFWGRRWNLAFRDLTGSWNTVRSFGQFQSHRVAAQRTILYVSHGPAW